MSLDQVQNSTQQLAIEGQGIDFHYGRNKHQPILRGVDINVNEGTIYGLLGPSGCGKTTLLKCIIGRLRPKVGEIMIFGRHPGDSSLLIPGPGIGYMPQELALYQDITVEETLVYFGSLCFMTKKELKERVSFFIKFLDLPNKNRLISNLSGGQQRRVSFASALIHQPPLLVLDEPTVGVDPLLRCSIWKHLKELAAENHTTIIITTHYVEEARKANTVAFMIEGRILAETNPEDIIQRSGVQTLEDVFWKLCEKENNDRKQDEETKPNGLRKVHFNSRSNINGNAKEHEEIHLMEHGAILGKNNDNQHKVISPIKKNFQGKSIACNNEQSLNSYQKSLRKTKALCNKSFTCLRRNKLLAIFQILIPALEITIFSLAIGYEPFDLNFAIVNKEVNIFGFSETFVNSLSNKTFNKISYDNLSVAINSVKKGETWGVMYIGPKFSSAMTDRILEGNNAANETIRDSKIKLYLDLTNQQVALTIYVKIIQALQEFSRHMLETLNENTYLVDPPVGIEEPIYGSQDMGFSKFIVPGIILIVTFLFAMGLTVISIIIERREGLLDRCWVIGVSATEMIIAILSVLFITMIAQIILVLVCAIFIFDLPVLGSPFWLFICVLICGACGMTFGLLVSAVCENEIQASLMALGTFFTVLIFSGVIWPIEGMPYYLRYISYSLPYTILIKAVRSIMLRGWSIMDNQLWLGCIIASAWGVFFTIMSGIVLKRKMSK